MKRVRGSRARNRGKRIPGADAFRLYDTYGFPVDLTADIARERGLDSRHGRLRNRDGRSSASARARRASSRARASMPAELASALPPTKFLGYDALGSGLRRCSAIVRDGRAGRCSSATARKRSLILDRTPFYAESGGQVGDTGVLVGNANGRFDGRATRSSSAACSTATSAAGHGGSAAQSATTLDGAGRQRAPPGDRAESFGDASAARGAAPGARRARAAEGLAGRAGSAAFRFLAFHSR